MSKKLYIYIYKYIYSTASLLSMTGINVCQGCPLIIPLQKQIQENHTK